MSFKVTLVGQRGRVYRISTGDGRPVDTDSLEGVALALHHYYGTPSHYKSRPPDCPFCQAIA